MLTKWLAQIWNLDRDIFCNVRDENVTNCKAHYEAERSHEAEGPAQWIDVHC